VISLVAALLGAALISGAPPEVPPDAWRFRPEGQLPVIAANHAVGGFGLGLGIERGFLALELEAQIFPIEVCDLSCGMAYGAGLGLSAHRRIAEEVSARAAVFLRGFTQPTLHEEMLAVEPRVGLRSVNAGTGLSLDAGVAFASSSNFEIGGFARNKILSWGMPELVLGLWF